MSQNGKVSIPIDFELLDLVEGLAMGASLFDGTDGHWTYQPRLSGLKTSQLTEQGFR